MSYDMLRGDDPERPCSVVEFAPCPRTPRHILLRPVPLTAGRVLLVAARDIRVNDEVDNLEFDNMITRSGAGRCLRAGLEIRVLSGYTAFVGSHASSAVQVHSGFFFGSSSECVLFLRRWPQCIYEGQPVCVVTLMQDLQAAPPDPLPHYPSPVPPEEEEEFPVVDDFVPEEQDVEVSGGVAAAAVDAHDDADEPASGPAAEAEDGDEAAGGGESSCSTYVTDLEDPVAPLPVIELDDETDSEDLSFRRWLNDSGPSSPSGSSSSSTTSSGSTSTSSPVRPGDRSLAVQRYVYTESDAEDIDTDDDENGDLVIHRVFMYRATITWEGPVGVTRELLRELKEEVQSQVAMDSAFLARDMATAGCPRDCVFVGWHVLSKKTGELKILLSVAGHMFKRQTADNVGRDLGLIFEHRARRYGTCQVVLNSLE